jgi:esterase/lipase superfamily enzyme
MRKILTSLAALIVLAAVGCAPRPGSQIGTARKADYAIVRIFYATDRNPTGNLEPAGFYGTGRAQDGNLLLGTCEVSIPRDHRMGELEEPSIWRLEFREDPEKHIVLLKVEQQGYEQFYNLLSARVQESSRKEALVFIHGFNVSFEDAARRTAQLSYDLGFDGAPILYSWPSEGRLLRYTVDETNVKWTASHLRRFLHDVAKKSNATKIHLVAHSMGNRALTRVLESLAAEFSSIPKPRFSQVILMAPDIDADVFAQLAQRMQRIAERVTLYASSNDQALKASKEIHGYRRAGESGDAITVILGIDTIDVSSVDTSLLGHSYYAERRSVLSDMFTLIRDGTPPSERFGLVRVPLGSYFYYKFVP